ncbi:FkbM family methyltransferase [Nocardiopsis mwathae]|uniref:FkbM family methyltransferase n=1 Tax=Nocardiopsis mwathae TaxID=1472723 RepID=A0A7W9YK50_9ACTN|nr:FkbM family methyltransferase [Nocardiopsis mwathae]MBB6173430.1 FkbM family methyltransferase [Nocardiopsis mwathae]
MRAFVRRHPAVRHATRQIRVRLPQSLGGLDPARLPPKTRRFDLALPRREGAGAFPVGPDRLSIEAPGDSWIPRCLDLTGLAGYDREALACFLAVLEHARPGSVLDVGANMGLYAALAAARTRRRVYAFEPAPDTAATARAVAAANGLGIEVVELAASNHGGTGHLHLSMASDASNSLVPGFRPALGRIEVEVDTLSHWRERAGTAPAVIKIDTEGNEPDVIAGALEILRRFRPFVFCAVLPDQGIEERLMALLEPVDYQWYRLVGAPPYPPRPAIGGIVPGVEQTMWMFAPAPVPDRVWATALEWHAAIGACR